MSERIAGSPSKRVSKIFSFRTKDQTGKRRRRKDDADENEDDSKYLNWKYYHIMNTIIMQKFLKKIACLNLHYNL